MDVQTEEKSIEKVKQWFIRNPCEPVSDEVLNRAIQEANETHKIIKKNDLPISENILNNIYNKFF